MMKNKLFLPGILILIFTSCDPGMVYDKFEKVENQEWKWEDVKRFEVEMTDTQQSYNIYANIRHTKDYPLSNLYLFITIKGPMDNVLRDTVEIQIARADGKWLGKNWYGSGFGEIKFVRSKIRSDVRFAHSGLYVFEVEQGMRLPSIPVSDVGIRIEKYKSLN